MLVLGVKLLVASLFTEFLGLVVQKLGSIRLSQIYQTENLDSGINDGSGPETPSPGSLAVVSLV